MIKEERKKTKAIYNSYLSLSNIAKNIYGESNKETHRDTKKLIKEYIETQEKIKEYIETQEKTSTHRKTKST